MKAAKYAVLALLIAGLVAVRLWNLAADPPPWLSFSAGIYTDEGIYAADARDQALFGHWCPGDFHGALVSPPLYVIQLAAFRAFGATLLTAREISVTFGLLTLFFLWLTMHRLYGRREAWTAVLLLGFSAPFVLYNRLALIETPMTAVLTAAAALFVSAQQAEGWRKAAAWSFLGVVLAVAVAFKSLALLALPAFAIALWRTERPALLPIVTGFVLAFLVYWLDFLWPFAHGLSRMNAFYLTHQLLPHSWSGVGANLSRGLFTGERDGVLPRLLVLAFPLLALGAFGVGVARRQNRAVDILIIFWLLTPFAAFLLLDYTPTRYLAILLPPLAALAAIAVCKLPVSYARATVAVALALSLLTIQHALVKPLFSETRASQQLAKLHAPPETLLIGQFAPTLAFGTRLVPVYVAPGLANDRSLQEPIAPPRIVRVGRFLIALRSDPRPIPVYVAVTLNERANQKLPSVYHANTTQPGIHFSIGGRYPVSIYRGHV